MLGTKAYKSTREKSGLKNGKTSHSPFFFSVSSHSLKNCCEMFGSVSARARSEWKRLRSKSISSIWSTASQEFSAVGNDGVGVVSLGSAPLALPTFATPGFERFFGLGLFVAWFL